MNYKIKRYSIVPQMLEYDKLIANWVPYLMYFNQQLFSGSYVNTDEHGFRKTVMNNGLTLSYKDFVSNKKFIKKNIVLGGSTAFGVGATNDRYTIASNLNKISNELWFNFGGRAFVSTQELMIFLLFFPDNLKNIVIFSGINNLLISCVSPNMSKIFTPFFQQSKYEERVNNINRGKGFYLKKLFASVIKNNQQNDQKNQYSFQRKYEDLLFLFSRDMKIISTLANYNQTQITFVMQPFIDWIKKELSDEEIKLMKISNKLYSDMKKNYSIMREHGSEYINDIENICNQYDINFININKYKTFLSNKWLFVDRVHLTDEGYLLSSNILKDKLGL